MKKKSNVKCPIKWLSKQIQTQMDMKKNVRSYVIDEDGQLLGNGGDGLTDDP